jgi:C1A family cysteine protease
LPPAAGNNPVSELGDDIVTELTPRRVAGLGWIPDTPDHRDLIYRAPPHVAFELPPSIDLRKTGFLPAIYDQGQLGSCTANAIGGAIEFDLAKQGLQAKTPSRLFIYYNERLIEGTVREDSGAMIRDGVRSCNRVGVCSEDLWPYNIAKFKRKPTVSCYSAAASCTVTQYDRIVKLDDMKGCLAEGYPFVFGFSVYKSFEGDEVAHTGIVPMPKLYERQVGGHAVLAVGYDDNDDGGRFIVRNSWGTGWGQEGYFTIPYQYLTNANLADDMWRMTAVSGQVKEPRA